MAVFEAEVFEELHGRTVWKFVTGSGVADPQIEAVLFGELRKHKDALSRPFMFRGREDTVDLPALARHIAKEHPVLATETLVRATDEVSRALRLHQHDACRLFERCLAAGTVLADAPRRCAGLYFRECHFVALCLHDMAQGLGQRPPDRCSVAFFRMLGGPAFVKSMMEALGLLLRDLGTERTGDAAFVAHASTMIQLSVETLLAYFSTFKASAEDIEQVVALLPHVVMSQHAHVGSAFTVSDLDLILRGEHVDIGTKLCFALLCMLCPKLGDGRVDLSALAADVSPAMVRTADLATNAEAAEALVASAALDAKIRAGSYWNEDNPLGQFLAFAVNGVMLDDEKALRNGFVHWHTLSFMLQEVLLSTAMITEPCTGQIVLKCIHELLLRALLPIGRRWIAIRKLEAQAVSYRMLAPDALQIVVLQTLNRLCRVYPSACDSFRDIALHCTDTFHLALAAPSQSPLPLVDRQGLPGGPGLGLQQSLRLGYPRRDMSLVQPVTTVATGAARVSGTALYAEIIGFLASICARGSVHCLRLMCQKLMSHSNQWFNWGFLMDVLVHVARTGAHPSSQQAQMGAAPTASQSAEMSLPTATPIVVSLCHLVSAVCSTRLWISHPPPQTSVQALQLGLSGAGGGGTVGGAEGFAALLSEMLGSHTDVAVKAACLGALAHLDLAPSVARTCFGALTASLPSLLAGISDFRTCRDGALAIELLACALQLVQCVPLGKGRYSMDLMPLTRIVLHQVLSRVLTDASRFTSSSRYWRLASLTLKWLRLVLRGPLPPGASSALNLSLVRLYADSEATAAEVAMCAANGNATAYTLRCVLALGSPAFAQIMYFALLRGAGAEGLLGKHVGGAPRPFMEQVASAGLDIVRLLLQRDVLFSRLYGQHAADRAAGSGGIDVQASGLSLAHNLLFAEFPFPYPPAEDEASGSMRNSNPFSGKRLWQSASTRLSAAGVGGRKTNPSYLALLLEFVGVHTSADIRKFAAFAFLQCSLREPSSVLRALQLEPWRLQLLCTDLHDIMLQAEEENVIHQAAMGSHSTWNARAEAQFMFEAAEMDAPLGADYHLDVVSFHTGLPVSRAVELACHLADDASVQASDLISWAHGSRGLSPSGGSSDAARGASADAWQFGMGYLRGLSVPPAWLEDQGMLPGLGGAGAALNPRAPAPCVGPPPLPPPPPPMLQAMPCRLLLLRSLALFLAGAGPETDAHGGSSRLGQVLLGLDPDAPTAAAIGSLGAPRGIDVDTSRAGQPLLLDALFELLENPPPLPGIEPPESGAGQRAAADDAFRPHHLDGDLAEAVEQHSTYEAAVSLVLSLLSTATLRDVALRYMSFAWPSRYQVLRTLLCTDWDSLPSALLRVLLSETVMMLQVAGWEMRSVKPLGTQTFDSRVVGPAGIDEQQRKDMHHAVAEHLREVVQSFCAPSPTGHLSGCVQRAPPLLVDAVTRLAELCDAALPMGLAATDSAFHNLDGPWQAALQASSCRVMTPSDTGCLSLRLELHDPFVFAGLLDVSRIIPEQQNGLAAGSSALFTGLGLGSINRTACLSSLAKAILAAVVLFFQATLYHFGTAGGVGGVDMSGECAERLLEAMLPTFAAHGSPLVTSIGFDLFTKLAAAVLVAMQRATVPPSYAFARSLYVAMRAVSLQAPAARDGQSCSHQALLLVVQRLLPVVSDAGQADAALDDAVAVRGLIHMCLKAAMASPDAGAVGVAEGASGVSVAVALLMSLLTRASAKQLEHLFGDGTGGQAWPALAGLMRGSALAPRATQVPNQILAMSIVGTLCGSSALAAECFESGSFAAVLAIELPRPQGAPINAASARGFSDRGQLVLMYCILRTLVRMATSLPAHALVALAILTWLEKNQRPLAELLDWAAHQPLTTDAETGAADAHPLAALGALPAPLDHDLARGASSLGAAGRRPRPALGWGGPDLLMPDAETQLRIGIAGKTRLSDDDSVRRSYECVKLLAELWTLMQSIVTGLGGDVLGRFRHLEQQMSDAFSAVLAYLSVSPGWDARFGAGALGTVSRGSRSLAGLGVGAGADASGAAGGSSSLATLRLEVAMRIVHIWRCDSPAQVRAFADSGAAGHVQGRGGAGLFAGVGGAWGAAEPLPMQMRKRIDVLCNLFVQACDGLLGVSRYHDAGPTVVSNSDVPQPQLLFQGSCETYGLLHSLAELSMHVLYVHLGALVLAAVRASSGSAPLAATMGSDSSPFAGWGGTPRLASVLQRVRSLRYFASAVGGVLVPVHASAMGSVDAGGRIYCATPPTAASLASARHCKALRFGFVVSMAEQIEELLLQLQGL